MPSCPVPTTASGDAVEPPSAVAWWRGGVVGVVTGLGSPLLVVAPVVLAWLVEPLATGTAWQAVGTGSALWLLVSGAHLLAGEVTISLVPLLGWGCSWGRRGRGARGDGRRVDRRRVLARDAAPLPGRGSRGLVGRVRRGRRCGGRPRRAPGRSGSPRSRSSCRSSSFRCSRRASRCAAWRATTPTSWGPGSASPGCPTSCGAGCGPASSAPVLLLGGRPASSSRAVALSWGEVSTISREVGAAGLGGVVLALRPGGLAAQPRPVGRLVPGRPGVPGRRGRHRHLVGRRRRAAADGARARRPAAARGLPVVHAPVGARRRRGRWARRAPGARRGREAVAAAHEAGGRARRVRHDGPGPRRPRRAGGRLARPVPPLGAWGRPPAACSSRCSPSCRSGPSSSCSATPGGCGGDRRPPRTPASHSGSSSSSRARAATSRPSSTPRRGRRRAVPGAGRRCRP